MVDEERIKEIRAVHARRTLTSMGVDKKTLEDMMVMWEQNYPIEISEILKRFNDVANKIVEY